MEYIKSFTLKELLDNRDGNFIHHDKYTSELESPILEYCYANTAKFKIKSSQFGKQAKTKDGRVGTNNTWYNVFVMFEDFYTIGQDKEIPLEDAVDYAINFGEIHIRCSCPAHLYFGYSYMATQMDFQYGLPRENLFPIIRNPDLNGTICKHEDAVIQFIFRNKNLITKMFAEYYNRLNEGQSIYAVNTNGTTITIGKKEGENDVFFEQQQEYDSEEDVEEVEGEEVEQEEVEEESNLLEDGEIEEETNE